MDNPLKKQGLYEFGEFRLDSIEKRLTRNGETIRIQPKAFDLLSLLVQNQGHLKTKDEILREVWSDTVVEENNLSINIHALRKLLGDAGKSIETVPRRGYRFKGEVREINIGNFAVEQNISNITVRQTATPTVIDGTSVINQQTVVFTEDAASQVADKLHQRIRRHNLRLIGAVLLALSLAGIAYYFLRPNRRTTGVPFPSNVVLDSQVRTIAVLPFKNLTKERRDDALSIGLTDSLITKMGSMKRIAVRPTSAVLPFADGASPRAMSEKLHVSSVLEGTVQRIGNRLRVSVQLVAMPENKVLWARSLEEDSTDLLKIQESIAVQIASSLLENLTLEERTQLARNGTDSPEAFQLYLQGRYLLSRRTVDDLRKSIDAFEQAASKDPSFGLAHAGRADAYQLLAEYGGMPASEAFENSRQASSRALEINPDSAEARTSLAYTLAFYDWNWSEAESEFRLAISRNPNYPTAHQWFGEYLTTFGRFDEALVEIRRAEELDPTSAIIQTDIAAIYYLTRRFDRAVEQSDRVLEANPSFPYALSYRWISLEQTGQLEKAHESLAALDALFTPPAANARSSEAFRNGGWRGLWQLKYDLTKEPQFEGLWNNYVKAMSALRVGEYGEVFSLLEKAAVSRERWFVNLKFDPQWDPIRTDPRFAELIRRANLEP